MKKGTKIVLVAAAGGAALIGLAVLASRAAAKPSGTATLQGNVTTPDLDAPIPYATVTLDNFECSADENGIYRIDLISLGTYRLTVSAPGYPAKTVIVNLTEPTIYEQDVPLTPQTQTYALVQQI